MTIEMVLLLSSCIFLWCAIGINLAQWRNTKRQSADAWDRAMTGTKGMAETTTDRMILDIADELTRAREKFPDNKHQYTAFAEEAGELGQALLQCQYGGQTDEDVYREAVQCAAMAIRVGVEGDHSFNYVPDKIVVGGCTDDD